MKLRLLFAALLLADAFSFRVTVPHRLLARPTRRRSFAPRAVRRAIGSSALAPHTAPLRSSARRGSTWPRRFVRAVLACVTCLLLPRLARAAATTVTDTVVAAAGGLKPTRLGRAPTPADFEGYLVPFFAKLLKGNNAILRYGSIPVVAGLLNWFTNRLAVLMMVRVCVARAASARASERSAFPARIHARSLSRSFTRSSSAASAASAGRASCRASASRWPTASSTT